MAVGNSLARAGGALKSRAQQGARGAITGTGGSFKGGNGNSVGAGGASASSGVPGRAPDWAKRSRGQSRTEAAALHGMRGGDSGGSSPGPSLKTDD